ncbi:MAG: phage holin family protein [Gemmatimonadota bacterium]|nr:phage holin family protein [Gemmatimonadota bacterium]
MRALLLRLLVNAVALWAAARLVDGVSLVGEPIDIVIVAAIFGLVNALLKPLVTFFSFPLIVVTLGLFTLVVNAAMLAVTSSLSSVLDVDGFGPALLGALVVSIVSMLLNWLVRDEGDTRRRR